MKTPPTKFKAVPPIYYINLDRSPERNKYMLHQFRKWGMTDYARIAGYDGAATDTKRLLVGKKPDYMDSREIGCVLSHLNAIRHFYENSDHEYALICEDDAYFGTAHYWNFTWKDILNNLPYDWDIVQLAIINSRAFVPRLHRRLATDFSAACYLITRHHSAKLLRAHVVGDKYRLDNGIKPIPVSENLLYNSGVTYSIPLFCYNISLGSSIHPDHIERVHRASHEFTMNYWKRIGRTQNCRELFDYASF